MKSHFHSTIAGSLQYSFITHTFHNPTHLPPISSCPTMRLTPSDDPPRIELKNTLHPVIQMWSRPPPSPLTINQTSSPETATPQMRWTTRRRRKATLQKPRNSEYSQQVRVSHIWQCCCPGHVPPREPKQKRRIHPSLPCSSCQPTPPSRVSCRIFSPFHSTHPPHKNAPLPPI